MPDEPRLMHGDETMSPVDLPGSITIGGRPLLWTSLAIYLAALLLLLTDASALHGWAAELPPTATSARIVAITEDWEAATDRIVLGAARATVHGWWTRAQAVRFGGERAG